MNETVVSEVLGVEELIHGVRLSFCRESCLCDVMRKAQSDGWF